MVRLGPVWVPTIHVTTYIYSCGFSHHDPLDPRQRHAATVTRHIGMSNIRAAPADALHDSVARGPRTRSDTHVACWSAL
eukprot:2980569-Prymnesium_polylepis.1